MSTRGRKKAAASKAENAVLREPAFKKQKVGIDMTHIPESLRKEGYTSEEEKPQPKVSIAATAVVPDYLTCPICKELFIQPQMYGCGHTVCKMCIERVACPVCKKSDSRQPMTNFVVAQMIEAQFPAKAKKRQEELDEILDLKKKVQNYVMSSRYDTLSKAFDDFMFQSHYASSQDIIEYLMANVKSLKSPLKESELRYFLSLKMQEPLHTAVGSYIVKLADMSTFLDWIQAQKALQSRERRSKKKPSVDHTKMLPILLLCFSRPVTPFPEETYQKVAQVYDIDIGKALPLEEWKNQPSFWVKEVDLGDVRQPLDFRCSCGRIHSNYVDSEDDYEDSESDF